MTHQQRRLRHLQRAIIRRISDAGDMPIRLRGRSLEMIIRACGLDWRLGGDDHLEMREVDAFALEALVRLGEVPRS